MLPKSMRERSQWVISGPDKRPYFYDEISNKIIPADVTVPSTWMTYEKAIGTASLLGVNFGFVLHESDLFICIDFDVIDAEKKDKDGQLIPPNKWINEFMLHQQDVVTNSINTYKEISTSGKGIHIWIEGEPKPGAREAFNEVYSKERFIICTGQSFDTIQRTMVDGIVYAETEGSGTSEINPPNEIIQRLLEYLYSKSQLFNSELVEIETTESDDVIMERAWGASNSEKFIPLWQGDWQGLGYQSQSEADFSLISMLTFYTPSNEQVRRLFRMSALGKREKATKNDVYINRSLMHIRGREASEKSAILNSGLEAQVKNLIRKSELEKQEKKASKKKKIKKEDEIVDVEIPFLNDLNFEESSEIDYPPGVLGEVCKFIYSSSPRPVKEVSIVAALGFMAGAAGRAFHLPQTGLNLYIILVAQSAVGKEAMHSGIALLLRELYKEVPEVTNFVDFDEYPSGPALIKQLGQNASFVNVSGEFGKKLKAMTGQGQSNPALQSLRTAMINFYQKSGPQSVAGGLKYSDRTNNVGITGSVSYSLIGETTPGTLYNAITEEMMEDGFLSRFSLIQYAGERVPLNYEPITTLSPELKDRLIYILRFCITGNAMGGIGDHNSIEVKYSQAAWLMSFDFGRYCDGKINSHTNESYRQMWNRAHLKSIRIAGLIAVCENPAEPKIHSEYLKWSINVVLEDIKLITGKIKSGDIGTGDDARIDKVKSVLSEYLAFKPDKLMSLKIMVSMHKDNCIPRSYLQSRTCKISSFVNHKNGATFALNQSIQTLVDNGNIIELDKATTHKEFGTGNGKVFRIIKL